MLSNGSHFEGLLGIGVGAWIRTKLKRTQFNIWLVNLGFRGVRLETIESINYISSE